MDRYSAPATEIVGRKMKVVKLSLVENLKIDL